MTPYFYFLNYTDSNFSLNDGSITNIATLGGNGAVTVTISGPNGYNQSYVAPTIPDQLNLEPGVYTLSIIDGDSVSGDDYVITLLEKAETSLISNIGNPCDCDNCDCIVSIVSYTHNSDCFRYDLYDGANPIPVATFNGCTGDEVYQFTGLCTGEYRVEATELDSILYTFEGLEGCPEGEVEVTEAIILNQWKRFADFSFQYSGLLSFSSPKNVGGTVDVAFQNDGCWSGLLVDGTIDYNNNKAYLYVGEAPLSPTGEGANLAVALDRFRGVFSGADAPMRDGVNTTPTGYTNSDNGSGTPFLNDFYYNANTNKFVIWTLGVAAGPGSDTYAWITFYPIEPSTNGLILAEPNAVDFLTSNQWNGKPFDTFSALYTADMSLSNPVVYQATNAINGIRIEGYYNSAFFNGFYSSCKLVNYVHEVTIASTVTDDDDISIILCRYHDINGDFGPAGLFHNLTLDFLIRKWVSSGRPSMPEPSDSETGPSVSINYNKGIYHSNNIHTFTGNVPGWVPTPPTPPEDYPLFGGTDSEVNFESRLIYRLGAQVPIPNTQNWEDQGSIRIRIERTGVNGESFNIKMTDTFGTGGTIPNGSPIQYNPNYEFNFKLDDPATWVDAPSYVNDNSGTAGTVEAHKALEKFLGPTSYGYGTYSQGETQFYDIKISGEQSGTTSAPINGDFVQDENDLKQACPACYLATNCEDPLETITVTPLNFDPIDTNLIHTINGYPDKCWIIEVSDCDTTPIGISIVESYSDCEECLPPGIVYKLVDCNGLALDLIVSNDLSQYVGQVVKVRGSNCCWQVESFIGKTTVEAFVQFSFYSCDECLGVPIYEIVKPQRYVAPGYKYAACSTEFIDKVKCGFVDVMFKKMKSTLFSIDLCKKGDDKILLQNEALDLKLIQDKTEDLKTNNENCCKTFEFILNLNVSQEGTVSGVDCDGNDILVTLDECNLSVELCLDIEFDIETIGEIEVIKKNDCRL